jgi:hypothetical protein
MNNTPMLNRMLAVGEPNGNNPVDNFFRSMLPTESTQCVACLCKDAVLDSEGLCPYCSGSLQISQQKSRNFLLNRISQEIN